LNNIITRNCINQDIVFVDFKDKFRPSKKNLQIINFSDFSKRIDQIKNCLEEHKDKDDYTILIGLKSSIEQTATIYACLELGISIAIIDYGRSDNFIQYKWIDPKTEILLPIDLFLVDDNEITNNHEKFSYFHNICKKTIALSDLNAADDTENLKMIANPHTIAIKCTSSGTTGTPKRIEHTHEFIKAVSLRNSSFFDKSVGIAFNLNHGSAIATYFLPSLMSSKTTKIVHLDLDATKNFYIEKTDKIDHLMIPYKHYIEKFSKNYSQKDLKIYTLSSFPQSKLLKQAFEDVISFFGSNETSGPTLIKKLSNTNFEFNKFSALDNFYQLRIEEKTLRVKMPVYGTEHDTKDLFRKNNNHYYFEGRNDIYRINGTEVDTYYLNKLCSEFFEEFNIVIDVVRNNLYLAIWSNETDIFKKLKKINKKQPKEHHFVDADVLDKNKFLSGVKIDHELVRSYFRIKIDNKNL